MVLMYQQLTLSKSLLRTPYFVLVLYSLPPFFSFSFSILLLSFMDIITLEECGHPPYISA